MGRRRQLLGCSGQAGRREVDLSKRRSAPAPRTAVAALSTCSTIARAHSPLNCVGHTVRVSSAVASCSARAASSRARLDSERAASRATRSFERRDDLRTRASSRSCLREQLSRGEQGKAEQARGQREASRECRPLTWQRRRLETRARRGCRRPSRAEVTRRRPWPRSTAAG